MNMRHDKKGFKHRVLASLARLDRKLFGRRASLGLFGVDAAILIGFIVLLIIGFGGFIIEGLGALFRKLIEHIDIPPLLVYIPGMAGQPLFDQTLRSAAFAPAKVAGVYSVSTVMGQLYGRLQIAALIVFLVALIIVGISYVSEQFNLVSRGTSLQLLTESGFVLILLFLFPLLYNAVAAFLNALNSNFILSATTATGEAVAADRIITEVANASTSFGLGLGPLGVSKYIPFLNIGDLIMTLVQVTVTFVAILSVLVSGVMRLVLLGVLAAGFPLILVFRLIPPIRNIAEQLQGALVGLMIGSVLVSILFRVSWGIINDPGLTTVMKWIVGCGTLITATTLIFMFTGGFARLARGVAGAITGPVSGVIGGMIAAGGWGAAGAVYGAGAAGLTAVARGLETGVVAQAVGRAALSGAAIGAKGPTALPVAVLEGRRAPVAVSKEALIEDLGSLDGRSTLVEKMAEFIGRGEFMIGTKQLLRNRVQLEHNVNFGNKVIAEWQKGTLPLDTKQEMLAAALPGNFKHNLEVIREAMKEGRLTERQLDTSFYEIVAGLSQRDKLFGRKELGGNTGAALYATALYMNAKTEGKRLYLEPFEGAVFAGE